MPSVSNEIQQAILAMVLPYVKRQFQSNTIAEYNPIGVADGEFERISTSAIQMIRKFYESNLDDNVYKEMGALVVGKINFYCISINFEGKEIFFFRQFQRLKRLRKGILTRIINDELCVMDTDFLSIDEAVDIVIFDQYAHILNHVSLERVFEYKDEFLKKTNEALGEILKQQIVENIEQFADDCCRDIRIAKRFTHIMTKGRLPLFFDNYEKVPEIVERLGLDIEFDENGKLIYREKSQLFHIVNLLSDSYFESLLAQRTGVAKIEGEV
jgi:hypothetical protein